MEKSLDKQYYFSDEIYDKELDRIFYSDWVCCSREEDIDSPGEYKIFTIGNENLFIIRDKDNEIRVVVHGDGLACLVWNHQLEWLREKIRRSRTGSK